MSEVNYSELKIVSTNDLRTRAYINFYRNGKRVREFNGKNLGLDIKPNYAKSLEERDRLLRKLHFELQRAIENNCYPVCKPPLLAIEEVVKPQTTLDLLNQALERKLALELSKYYKRNLISIHRHFIGFLSKEELDSPITDLKRNRIEQFLIRYNSSGTYYMNKRRDLGVLFSYIGKEIEQKLMAIQDTDTMKSKAKLHKVYEQSQIKPILDYLKCHHPNLHLCCLITYGCFLRPHEEVRSLCMQDFKKGLSEIHLSGKSNKGGRVRVVYVPEYVQVELLTRFKTLNPGDNIFSRTEQPYNNAYFNTAWTRAWLKMNDFGLIKKNQTIYSFRHTAAVNIYRKTKDLNILQQLLGHSDMIVTLKYLRGLGEATNEELRSLIPEL